MVLVHDTLSHCALQLMKFHLNSFNGCQLTERTRNTNVAFTYVTRGII